MVRNELTHASFFSGVGGLDLGLERAGWRTVSFSEIEPYACAVLTQRWPGVPNLGSIVDLAEGSRGRVDARVVPDGVESSGIIGRVEPWHGASLDTQGIRGADGPPGGERMGGLGGDGSHLGLGRRESSDSDWQRATLWTGGFPCQDLSIAGKRRGFGIDHGGRVSATNLPRSEGATAHASDRGTNDRTGQSTATAGTRSGLAFSFLALAERHRPRFVLLENVPGLLSSHGGRDMAALIGALVELGYGVGYRILDARYFGVPQRRRRVFILGDSLGGRAGAERASEVLSVGSRCRWHPPTGIEAGTDVAARTRPGVDFSISPALTSGTGTSGGHNGIDDAILAASYGSGGGRTTRALTVSGGNDEEAGYGPLIPTLTNPDRLRWDATYPISAGPPHDARGQGWRRERAADLGGYEPDDGYEPDPDAIRRAERPQADSDRMRATHELAGRAHNRDGLEDLETYVTGTLREHVRPGSNTDQSILTRGGVTDDPLLPLGLDSHRYRCCGNGVVSDVSEWIGHRLAAIVAS